MSRIEQAFRKAANLQAIDYDATLVDVDEYPKEPGAKESGTGFDRVAPSPAMSRQSSDTGRTVTLSVSPASDVPAPASDVPAPRLIAVPPPEGDASPLESSRPAFIVDDRSSLFQQRCRRVAAHLRELQAQRELKTLMLTSVDETGGKTRAALNLAMALANISTRQVLLIDANLRRPLVHDLVGCGNDHGLADVLRGVSGVPLHRLTPLVHVLPAGSPIPYVPELASERMGTLLAQCAARYEWVLVDAPADSQLALGTFVHGAVFVIDSSTPFPVAGKAMTELGADRVVATILIGLEDGRDTLIA